MNSLFLTEYELRGAEQQRLFSQLSAEGIEVCCAVSDGDTLRLSVPLMSVGRFERLIGRLGITYEIKREGPVCRLPRIMKRRAGLIVGAVICAAAIIVSERYVLNIEVLTDDEDIRSGVMNVLLEEGVGVGSYIPSLECAEIERALKQRVGGISWAGISKTDCTIIIDVIEKTEKPESRVRRLPSDLVAKHSGTIDKIELYDGLLKIPIGSGVERGEVIVSGRIPVVKSSVKDGKTVTDYSERYVRSLGTAYGTYTEIHSFTQPYSERYMIMNGKRSDRSYLRIFGADIPLFVGGEDGLFRERESYTPLVVFGREIPAGIRRVSREGYSFGMKLFTREQAAKLAEEQMYTFERDFLSDDRIISRKTDVIYGDREVTLTVKYEIYGVMSMERQFFIKK